MDQSYESSVPTTVTVPNDPPETGQSQERLHALDAVRGFALMLGIVFHSTMSFLNGGEDGWWLIVDKDPSTALSVLFYVLHMFRMATFFFIAGFFAHLLFHRRGQRAFVRDRMRRIGLPLMVGWPFLFASIVGCAIWGAWVMHGALPAEPPQDPNAGPLAFPLTHLWFLYVLLWLYGLTLLTRAIVERLDGAGRGRARLDRVVSGLIRSPFGVLILAAPTCAALMAVSNWRPWLGIPTPDMTLLPNIAAATAFGSAFGFGWLMHRQVQLLNVLEARWPLNLAIAVAATGACLAHVGVIPSIDVANRDLPTLAYAASYALAVWCWSFGLIGLALRFLAGYSALRRYIADASYWLYLIHLPIVLVLQILVSQLAWPWWIKFPMILAVGFPIMFASYHYLVRSTFIGAVLNGRRYPRAPMGSSGASAPASRTRMERTA